MYLKRKNIGKFWPVPRKGTKYLAVPNHNNNEAISLVVVMRDVLKLVRNKKELKRLLNEGKILINNKTIKETNYPVSLFDIISIPESKKNYKAILSEHKKMVFEEVSGKDSESKIYKVLNKKLISKNKIQFNLMHGRNIITKEKISVGDSLVINLRDGKIEKIIPIEKGKEVFINEGKHAGYFGKIEEIVERGGKMIAKINSKEGRVNVWVKNIIAVK